MYIPNPFNQGDEQELFEIIRKNSFAVLATGGPSRPVATDIPVEMEQDFNGKLVLKGHVAKGNPHSGSILDGEEALLIFQGPHAYVSSGWYSHLNVPAWNYMAVHMYGTLKPLNEAERVESLARLVDRYETGREHRVSVNRMPPDFLSRMIQGVTGFQMSMDTIQGNFKLSQNRNTEDYESIISPLV